jgi:hypothetical protein
MHHLLINGDFIGKDNVVNIRGYIIENRNLKWGFYKY